MSKLSLGIVLACVLATGVGCTSVETTSNETASGDANQTFVVRGLYVGRAMGGEAMRVTHEAIPGYMAAMTMDFAVRDTSEILGLVEGDKVEFTLTLTEMEGYAHDIHKLAPETKLEIPE